MVEPLVTRAPKQSALLRRLHSSAGVETRHLVRALETYAQETDFSRTNDDFLGLATDLGALALEDALERAGVVPQDVDVLVLTSVTGLGAPSIDVAIAQRLGMRPDVVRVPAFGWGCAGGVAGLARAHDLLAARPHGVAVLVAVELCSLTLQREDHSPANLVASGLFGDGAAAAVLVGEHHPLAGSDARIGDVLGSRSVLHPGTREHLGWDIGASGFRIVLSPELPDLIAATLADDVKALLAAHDRSAAQVSHWVAHAGGPRILDAVGEALELAPETLTLSRRSLAERGNLSSVSVLDVLARTAATPGWRETADPLAVLLAFGPGVSTDLLLLAPAQEG